MVCRLSLSTFLLIRMSVVDEVKGVPYIEAEVTLFSRNGEHRVVHLSGDAWYMPHLVVGDIEQRVTMLEGNMPVEEYLGVWFLSLIHI